MYCCHCGKSVHEEDIFCEHCGKRLKAEVRHCPNCGETIDSFTQICPNCHLNVPPMKTPTYNPKSKLVAGLLGIFVGAFGVHNFYLGNSSKGFIQLMLFLAGFVTFGMTIVIAEVWGFVEGVLILVGHINQDAEGNSLKD